VNLWVPRELHDSIRPERVQALLAFGYTERQARFLVHVLVHSGVFLERQYRLFAGIAHGQKTHDFLQTLVERKHVTVMTPGKVHSGRLYHVQYKPLYEAIGEPDNRHRKVAAMGRLVERLMLLDVVLKCGDYSWLGTEKDKLAYFRALQMFDGKFRDEEFPRVLFGGAGRQTVRYFPDKLPIGIERANGSYRHLFVYLVRRPSPSEFRLFLLRHATLLLGQREWTLRIVVPRAFRKAAALHRWALRDELFAPVPHSDVDGLEWYLRTRYGRDLTYTSKPQYLTLEEAANKFNTRRFEALHRMWLHEGYRGIAGASSPLLKEHLEGGRGRIEFMDLPHQYLQLTSLVGVA
jgi:hypothetical protein